MSLREFRMFSASGLSILNPGDIVPDFSKLFPGYFASGFRPSVTRKYDVSVTGIMLYKGHEFVHNVEAPDIGSIARGAVLELSGEDDKMMQWCRELDEFESSYGMQKRIRSFDRLDGNGIITATMYVLNRLDDIGDKDGALSHMVQD